MSSPTPAPAPRQNRPSSRRSRRHIPPGASAAPRLIGVGVDGTPSSRDAVVLGSLFARSMGAELMLIGVHQEPLVPIVLPGDMSWTALEQQAQTMLAETRDSLAPDARTVVFADVLIWRGLRHVVRREHRDLLVVGSARTADEGSVQLGRSANELFAHLECPLAIAPAGFRDRDPRQLQRIAVGFDDRPESRAALGLAASIASACGAELDVRGVIDDQVAGGLTTEQIVLEGKAIVAEQLASAFQRDTVAVQSVGGPAQIDVRAGSPTEILAQACEHADLLVIGSGHDAPPRRVQPGSTGRALLRRATCPLLLLPRPPATSAKPD